MRPVGHLYLDQISLSPSAEWSLGFDGWCFARVAKGQGYWLGLPEPCALDEGQLIVVFPGRRRVFRASQLSEFRLDYFRFCPEMMTGFLTPAERHGLEILAKGSEKGARFFGATHRAASWFAEVVTGAPRDTQLQVRCQLLQVAGLAFARELRGGLPTEAGAPSAGGRLRQLMNQLTEAEMMDASALGLAQRCGCSVRHFNRLFLLCFGVSFRSRQSELRLTQARRLLAETQMPVREVAHLAGFRHLGIFYSGFKKLFGMTPVECRRVALGSSNGEQRLDNGGAEFGHPRQAIG